MNLQISKGYFMEKISQYLKATSFVELTGSEKQINWAKKIRQETFPVFEKHLQEFENEKKNEKFSPDEVEDKMAFTMGYFFPMHNLYNTYAKNVKNEANYEKMENWILDNYKEMLDSLKKIDSSAWWIDWMRSVDHKALITNIFNMFCNYKKEHRKFGY